MLSFKEKFGEAIVYSDIMDEASVSQLYEILETRQVENESVRIMPDNHMGSGCLIGYTQTYSGGWLNPDTTGCDVACGMLATKYELGEQKITLEEFDRAIRKIIPMGMNINEKWERSREKDFKKFLKNRLEKFRSLWPEMIKYEGLGNIEQFITQFCRRIGLDEGIWWKSLGTLGGGNHFIEIAQNSDDKKHAWVVIHTGSRNLGIKVWRYWKNLAKKGRTDKVAIKAEELRIKKEYAGQGTVIKDKILAFHKSGKHTVPPSKFLTQPEDISGYLQDVFVLSAWAEFNRFLISERIKSASKNWLKKSVEVIESVHNYIDPYDRIIRKGAIKADEGKSLIIPISMQFGSIIGTGLGNSDWNNSAPHGAGRRLSRGQAKNQITMKEFEESMKGITSSSVVPECLDEAPMAYKDPNSIISEISDTTITIREIIKPLLNIKDKGGKGDGREGSTD